MLFRILTGFSLIIFATGVLAASIFRTTSPQYVFSQSLKDKQEEQQTRREVDYYLAYPGILPDHFLWPVKALRDKIWLFLTTDPLKRGELLLLFADKRINAARVFMEGGKPGESVLIAIKAEKYLEDAVDQEKLAREKGADTWQFLDRLALSSLKHREVLEELYIIAPEDARPRIAEILNYPKNIFDNLKPVFRGLNKDLPASPFGE